MKIKRITKTPVTFAVLYEVNGVKEFQAEGHFVPALRSRDAEGKQTMQPRKWKGANVHALTLLDASGQVLRTKNPTTGELQSTARALSDSREEAELIIADQIREGFYGQTRALAIIEFSAEQARRVKDERDRLVGWMIAHAPPAELAKALGIAEAAVEEYKHSITDPNLKSSVDRMLEGGL